MVMMALWGLLAVLAITMGAKAVDTPFAIHMFIFALAAILALIFKARSFGKPAEDTSGYMDNVVRYGAIATAVAAVTTRLRSAPARMFATEPSVSLAFEVADVTSRLSWKAGSVITAFVTARVEPWPRRTLPRSKVVAASVAEARS